MKNIKQTLRRIGDNVHRDICYTVGYSSMAGLGNAIKGSDENENFNERFGEGFVNNFPLGSLVNMAYPLVFNKLIRTKHPRLYANLFTGAVNLGFLAYHYLAGTDNPLGAMIPNTAIGLVMANKHISEIKPTLESRIKQ